MLWTAAVTQARMQGLNPGMIVHPEPVTDQLALANVPALPWQTTFVLHEANTPGASPFAEAVQRARRIVPEGTAATYDATVLKEPAELALHEAVSAVEPAWGTDLAVFTTAVEPLVAPLSRFFDEVFVMADDPAVRAARLGLLATVRDLGTGLLDWAELRL